MADEYKFLQCVYEKGGVARVVLNRPEVHNAFHDGLIIELRRVFLALEGDDQIRLAVLEGAGKSFSAGGDLNWMRRMKEAGRDENLEDAKKLALMMRTLNRFTKPLIAKVQGFCLGGGTGLIACCDYVLASENARFGFTEVKLGLVPSVISPYVISKIGESAARAWFLSGAQFDAREALAMGLVHQLVPEGALGEAAQQQVEIFLQAGPEAVREAKALIFEVLAQGTIADRVNEKVLTDYTAGVIAERRTSAEGQEGMSALLEKRKPKWVDA